MLVWESEHFLYIIINSFYNNDVYWCNTLFLLWSDHTYFVTDCLQVHSKLWDPLSVRIQRWRLTGGGSEMWRGGNRSRNRGMWPKHLGHCHLKLIIILSTQLLRFGIRCAENWSQRETEEKQRWLLHGGERIHQNAWCLGLWCSLNFLCVCLYVCVCVCVV